MDEIPEQFLYEVKGRLGDHAGTLILTSFYFKFIPDSPSESSTSIPWPQTQLKYNKVKPLAQISDLRSKFSCVLEICCEDLQKSMEALTSMKSIVSDLKKSVNSEIDSKSSQSTTKRKSNHPFSRSKRAKFDSVKLLPGESALEFHRAVHLEGVKDFSQITNEEKSYIFEMYPQLLHAYEEEVPNTIAEEDFWKKYYLNFCSFSEGHIDDDFLRYVANNQDLLRRSKNVNWVDPQFNVAMTGGETDGHRPFHYQMIYDLDTSSQRRDDEIRRLTGGWNEFNTLGQRFAPLVSKGTQFQDDGTYEPIDQLLMEESIQFIPLKIQPPRRETVSTDPKSASITSQNNLASQSNAFGSYSAFSSAFGRSNKTILSTQELLHGVTDMHWIDQDRFRTFLQRQTKELSLGKSVEENSYMEHVSQELMSRFHELVKSLSQFYDVISKENYQEKDALQVMNQLTTIHLKIKDIRDRCPSHLKSKLFS